MLCSFTWNVKCVQAPNPIRRQVGTPLANAGAPIAPANCSPKCDQKVETVGFRYAHGETHALEAAGARVMMNAVGKVWYPKAGSRKELVMSRRDGAFEVHQHGRGIVIGAVKDDEAFERTQTHATLHVELRHD